MATSSRRMHINEAVRTYNKTRQTFYNWIKKGYLRSKKVHNKLYILIDDVEKLISEYLEGEAPTTPTGAPSVAQIEQPVVSTPVSTEEDDAEVLTYELLNSMDEKEAHLLEKLATQHQQTQKEIKEVRQELRTDIQRVGEGRQQQFQVRIHAVEESLQETQTAQKKDQTSLKITHKKLLFWSSYAVIVGVNLLIFSILA